MEMIIGCILGIGGTLFILATISHMLCPHNDTVMVHKCKSCKRIFESSPHG